MVGSGNMSKFAPVTLLGIGVCRTLLNPWHKKNAILPLPRFDFSQYVLNNNMKFIEDENDSGYHITSFKIVFQAF